MSISALPEGGWIFLGFNIRGHRLHLEICLSILSTWKWPGHFFDLPRSLLSYVSGRSFPLLTMTTRKYMNIPTGNAWISRRWKAISSWFSKLEKLQNDGASEKYVILFSMGRSYIIKFCTRRGTLFPSDPISVFLDEHTTQSDVPRFVSLEDVKPFILKNRR